MAYYLIPASATGKALDVSGGSMKDGAAVGVYDRNLTDAQVFEVSERGDGTWRILSRLTGKSVDVPGGNIVAGQQVQMWTDNDTRAQQWVLNQLSNTVIIDGTSYQLYNININGSTLRLAVNGGNAVLASASTANAQRWALVPVPPFTDGGLYEIRSILDTSKALDVAGGSTANGANVQIYAANGTNAQKWAVFEGADGWSVRSIVAGRYMDVSGGAFADGTNVQSWEGNDTRAQQWSVYPYGTTVIEGRECQIVRLGAGNAAAYALDVSGGGRASGTNVQIWTANGTDAQRFALLPTEAEDPFMPAPYDLGIASRQGTLPTGGNTAPWGASMSFKAYPTWQCADAWATSGPNSYQVRERTRYMSALSSTWGEWSDWTAWETASTSRDGNRSWFSDGLDVHYTDSFKLAEVEFSVRSCGVDSLSLLHGAPVTEAFRFYPVPAVTLESAELTADGLLLTLSSTYTAGPTALDVESLTVGGTELLSEPLRLDLTDDSNTVLIPAASLAGVPERGAQASMAAYVGTDQMRALTGLETYSAPITYGEGWQDVSPAISEAEGKTLAVEVDGADNARLWIEVDGGTYECPRNPDGTFSVMQPFGVDYVLCGMGELEDGWFAFRREMDGSADSMHAWNWDGGFACLECREGQPLTVKDSTDAVYESYVLDSRPWETVSFAATRKRRFTVEGAVIKGVTSSQRKDFGLVAGVHAVYRSPAGDICEVAVVSIDRESHKRWGEIQVEMVQEG